MIVDGDEVYHERSAAHKRRQNEGRHEHLTYPLGACTECSDYAHSLSANYHGHDKTSFYRFK